MEDVLDELESKLPEDADDEIREIMDDLKENMVKIEDNGNRASSIVRGILLYSRGKDDEYIPSDLCLLTKEYVWLSYHAVRANNKSFNVSIIEEYDETLPLVKVIPQDFSRAVLNLMNNACYAVFNKSKGITESPYKPTIKVSLTKDGDRVRLVIEDNGSGITKEVEEKLYTPFFTTKPTAEAAGVGLYLCREVILNHQGSIIVKSEKDNFTEFMITIPIYQKSNDNG